MTNFLNFKPQLIAFIALLLATNAFSQKKITISGYISDKTSGENLPACAITIDSLEVGTVSNTYGFYSLSVPSGKHVLSVNYVGYFTIKEEIDLTEDVRKNFDLIPEDIEMEEILVEDDKALDNVNSTKMGEFDLDIESIKTIPVLFGEVDVMKTIQLLPGIQSAGEGNSGIYVRGGGPDQNLILLDEAVVYNTGHLFGFFSVFNGDAIKSVKLIKGGMPANYGGRLSSVVDVVMKDGNNKKFKAKGGIGLISSRLTLEGPIKKDKGSFIVSGRRTYVDALMQVFLKNTVFQGTRYYFYDLNAKANYKLSENDHLYFSTYFGKDVFKFNSSRFKIHIPWGNFTSTLRWNHLFNNKLFSNTSLIYNQYQIEISGEQDGFGLSLYSDVRDYNFKSDFSYFPNPKHEIKFGVNYVYHRFRPGNASGKSGDVVFEPTKLNEKFAHEAGIYILDDFTISKRLKANVGLRYSLFQQVGPYTHILYDDGDILDTLGIYGKGEPVQFYNALEPRASFRLKLNDVSSVKAGFSYNNQYVHLVSNSGTTLPTDLWTPSSKLVKPQKGWQISAGYFRNFHKNMFEMAVEAYYKSMKNQVDFREGYTPDFLYDIEREFVYGEAWSYGLELFFKKRLGKLNGWIGYTLSKTEKKFPLLNGGEQFPAKYDRRHDLSIVAQYELNKRWSFGATFVYGTGNAITLPAQRYFVNQYVVNYYGKRNSFRIKAYHRLDLSATLKPKPEKQKKIKSSWTFAIYNAYSRLNPYIIYPLNEGNPTAGTFTTSFKQISIFPIIPSVTWNFEI